MPTVVLSSFKFNPIYMYKINKTPESGQALVEYLLIFSFVTFLAIGMVKGMGKTMTESVGYIGYELTEILSTGVCPRLCYFNGFINQEEK